MAQSSLHPSLRLRILRSGSAGNAIAVEAEGARLLVDAGLPAESLLRELAAADPPAADGGAPPRLDAVLLTHEHDDHARGAGALARATGAVVLANEATLRAAAGHINGAPTERFRTGEPLAVGPVTVTPFPVSHDAAEPVGFVLAGGGLRVAVACDLGAADERLIEHARGCDVLLIEANYDLRLLGVSSYPWFLKNRIASPVGHLSNEGAARAVLACATGAPQTVYLLHLSEVNNLAPLARDIVRSLLAAHGCFNVQVEAVRPNTGGVRWPGAAAPCAAVAPGRVLPPSAAAAADRVLPSSAAPVPAP